MVFRKYVFKHFNLKMERSVLAVDTGRVAKILRRVLMRGKPVYHTISMF